jgi:hypothetical protein
MISYCLENQFTPHELCDINHKQLVEARVEALPDEVDSSPSKRVKPSYVKKVIHLLKLLKACALSGVLNRFLGHLPRRPLFHLIYLTTAFDSHFPPPWKEAKVVTLPEPSKDPKILQNLFHQCPVHDRPTI